MFAKSVLALFFFAMLVACGGGEEKTFTTNVVNEPTAQVTRSIAASVAANENIGKTTALHVYQALYGKAPSYATYIAITNQIGSAVGYEWANTEATANVSTLTDAALATLVLNNLSITPTSLTGTVAFGTPQQAYDSLLTAVTYYFGWVGLASRGTVVVQLSQIIASFEVDTKFGVYSGAATAFNKQVAANSAYSTNPLNLVAAAIPVSGSSFYLEGYTQFSTTNGRSLVVVDPAAKPGVAMPVADMPKESFGDGSGFSPRNDRWHSFAYTRDPVTNLRTYRGKAIHFFVSGGKVFQVNLDRGQTPKALQISSLNTASIVVEVIAMSDAGDDAWVSVATTDGGFALIRSNTPASQAAASVTPAAYTRPAGVTYVDPLYFRGLDSVLRDAQGRAIWLRGFVFNGRDSHEQLFSAADLTPAPYVPGDAQLNTLFGQHTSRPMRGYSMQSANQIMAASWSADGKITLSNVRYTTKNGLHSALVTENAIYIVDGADIVRIPDVGAAQVMMTLPFDPKSQDLAVKLNVVRLSQTSTRVIVVPQNSYLQAMAIYSIPKAGGDAVALATAGDEGAFLTFYGTQSEEILYGVDLRGFTISLPHLKRDRVMRIASDGVGRTLIEASATVTGLVESKTPYTQARTTEVLPEIVGITMCIAPGTEPFCFAADFVEYRLDTHSRILHGQIPASVALLHADVVDGAPVPLLIGGNAADNSAAYDLSLFFPGVANSLTRVTRFVQ